MPISFQASARVAGVYLDLIYMIFIADLIACRRNCFMGAVACRPVTPKRWNGFLVWLL